VSAQQDARGVLETFAVDMFGDIDLPVDPVRIAQELDINVYTDELDQGVSGMLIKERGRDAEIYLNRADHKNRQRFTCAHELGHYIKRTNESSDLDFAFVDRRDALASHGTQQDEIYANQFAAELLMPEREVRSKRKQADLTLLAYMFGVSTEAMKFRLENLALR